jgi:type IV secretion system protein VirB9
MNVPTRTPATPRFNNTSASLRWAIVACALGMSATACAADIPTSPHDDKRLGVVNFNPNSITHVYVQRGVATHIALGPNDKIRRTAAGFGADCKATDPDNRWCIHAEVGDTSIFVRPKPGSSSTNNLEVVTSSRHYSFFFEVLPEFQPNTERPAFHRVTFNFVEPEPKPTDAAVIAPSNNPTTPTRAVLATLPPKNYEYWMHVLSNSEDIAPTAAHDNGQFTFFKFPNNRLMPSVFAIAADGTETMVSKHVEDDLLVVHRVAKRFILRLDNAAVGVWNKAFDQDGIPPTSGTTMPGTVRAIKGEIGQVSAAHNAGGQK